MNAWGPPADWRPRTVRVITGESVEAEEFVRVTRSAAKKECARGDMFPRAIDTSRHLQESHVQRFYACGEMLSREKIVTPMKLEAQGLARGGDEHVAKMGSRAGRFLDLAEGRLNNGKA